MATFLTELSARILCVPFKGYFASPESRRAAMWQPVRLVPFQLTNPAANSEKCAQQDQWTAACDIDSRIRACSAASSDTCAADATGRTTCSRAASDDSVQYESGTGARLQPCSVRRVRSAAGCHRAKMPWVRRNRTKFAVVYYWTAARLCCFSDEAATRRSS